MFLVVSKWEALYAHEAEFKEKGMAMRAELKKLPEVVLFESFFNPSGQAIVIMGYPDQATYQAIIQDPNGQYAKLMAEYNLDEHSAWLWSERGEAMTE